MFLNGCAGDAGPLDPVRDTVEATVAQVFNILPENFGSMSRGPARVALARQVAMYITHVACRLTLTDVGRLYARDRTTVSHACGVIEDLRDDATFDRVLDLVEMIVRFRLRTIARGHGE
jgi:chromosomal replication initiation ATPase DnaA